MGDGFGLSVFGTLNNLKVFGQGIDTLVMAAVNQHVRAEERMKKAAGLVIGGMKNVFIRMLMERSACSISDGTAKVKIDKLHSFADAEYRLFPCAEKIEC